MNTFVRKTGEDRSHINAERFGERSKETASIADNRPVAAAQQALSESLGNSPRVQSQVQLKRAMDQSRNKATLQLATAETVQRDADEKEIEKESENENEDENENDIEQKVMQGKFDPLQLAPKEVKEEKEEKRLPHEAWHVVQQKQGRVKPDLQ